MLEDLKINGNGESEIEAAIKQTIAPLEAKREEIVGDINRLETVRRDLEAQKDRLDTMLSAAKLRKRPGRKPGRAKREPASV